MRHIEIVLALAGTHAFKVPRARIPTFPSGIEATTALVDRMAIPEIEIILPLTFTNALEMPGARVPAFARNVVPAAIDLRRYGL